MEVPEEADGPGDGYDLRKRSNSGKSGIRHHRPAQTGISSIIQVSGQAHMTSTPLSFSATSGIQTGQCLINGGEQINFGGFQEFSYNIP